MVCHLFYYYLISWLTLNSVNWNSLGPLINCYDYFNNNQDYILFNFYCLKLQHQTFLNSSNRAGRKSQGYCQVCRSGCPTKFFVCVFCFAPEIGNATGMAKKKYMCVYCHMSKKSRVGRSGLIVVPGSGIQFRYFIFEISSKPSFIEAVLWQIMQFFYLLCSQFWQKASSWINKTLLLVKQQKWLSKLCENA